MKRSVIALVIAIGAGLLVAPAANAVCVMQYEGETEKIHYATGSNELYATKWHSVQTMECGPRGDDFLSISAGVKPRGGKQILCRFSLFDKVKMNPSPIADRNPRTRTKDCKPNGMSTTWNFKNRHLAKGRGDRTVTTQFVQVIGSNPDDRKSPVGPTRIR